MVGIELRRAGLFWLSSDSKANEYRQVVGGECCGRFLIQYNPGRSPGRAVPCRIQCSEFDTVRALGELVHWNLQSNWNDRIPCLDRTFCSNGDIHLRLPGLGIDNLEFETDLRWIGAEQQRFIDLQVNPDWICFSKVIVGRRYDLDRK